jgi:FixJ family two-component response regulator
MDKYQEIAEIVQEITEEATNFKNAAEPAEEVEALKELLDALTRGSKQVLERIDQYNDRRYR